MLELTKLNHHQLEATTAPEGPILVVAGAGTGKTRVLTTRIAYLIEKLNYDPNKILAITFTNKAAGEMRNRVANMVNNVYVPWIGTYHATCLKILKADINYIGRKNNFNVIDDEDQLSILRDIYKNGGIAQKDIKPKKALEVIEKVKMGYIQLDAINSIDKAKELGIYKFDELKNAKYINRMYNQRLLSANLLDFDDLLLFTYKLLSEHGKIREKWQTAFDYILVDEFQDTNELQFDILNLLIDQKKKNIFAVGDPDQTIYTWRGAYPNIFKDYLTEYKSTKTFVLDLNYRSTKNILKVANTLISHNNDRIKKNLSTDNIEGNNVVFYKGDSDYQEANYVSKQIVGMTKNKSFAFKDIIILYRAKYLSRAIEQELINNNIPYYVFGAVRFYQRREIKDLVAYLKLVDNPGDELSLKRVLNVPTRGIGNTTIDNITKFANDQHISFAEAFYLTNKSEFDPPWQKNSINQFINLIDLLITAVKDKTIVEAVRTIIKAVKYDDHIRSLDLAEERLENIEEFIKSIEEFENKRNTHSIQEFLHEISLYTDSDDNVKHDRNAVSLMTIHYAKGTEAKVVFIIGLNEGIFPSIKLNRENDIEEERRIAYVGITRSMEKLYLTCNIGFFPMSNSQLSVSRFVKDIGYKNLREEVSEMIPISNADLSWYDSNEIKTFEDNYNETVIDFKVGDVIAHTVFGSGVIISINGDMLDVAFKAPFGVKSLIKNHKAIKRLKN